MSYSCFILWNYISVLIFYPLMFFFCLQNYWLIVLIEVQEVSVCRFLLAAQIWSELSPSEWNLQNQNQNRDNRDQSKVPVRFCGFSSEVCELTMSAASLPGSEKSWETFGGSQVNPGELGLILGQMSPGQTCSVRFSSLHWGSAALISIFLSSPLFFLSSVFSVSTLCRCGQVGSASGILGNAVWRQTRGASLPPETRRRTAQGPVLLGDLRVIMWCSGEPIAS